MRSRLFKQYSICKSSRIRGLIVSICVARFPFLFLQPNSCRQCVNPALQRALDSVADESCCVWLNWASTGEEKANICELVSVD